MISTCVYIVIRTLFHVYLQQWLIKQQMVPRKSRYNLIRLATSAAMMNGQIPQVKINVRRFQGHEKLICTRKTTPKHPSALRTLECIQSFVSLPISSRSTFLQRFYNWNRLVPATLSRTHALKTDTGYFVNVQSGLFTFLARITRQTCLNENIDAKSCKIRGYF